MDKNIKNILFDFGGVIVGLDKQNAINRFKEIGLANIEDYLNEFRQSGIFLELEEGKLTKEEFYVEFNKLAGKEVPPASARWTGHHPRPPEICTVARGTHWFQSGRAAHQLYRALVHEL